MKDDKIKNALLTWVKLNNALRDADEKICEQLLLAERAGKRRQSFLLRIHSRLNYVRRERERTTLVS